MSTQEEDRTDIEWRDPQWIQFHGGLTPHNILDYLAQATPFYDSSCNNEILKMQTRYNNLQEMDIQLRKMTGVEYQLTFHRWPVLFIVQKQYRRSETEVTPLANYYILNGNIYQSPDLYQLLTSRMSQSLYHLDKAFQNISKHIEFTPGLGYSWTTSDLTTLLQKQSQMGKSSAETEDSPLSQIQNSPEFKASIDHLINKTAMNKNLDIGLIAPPTAPAGSGGKDQEKNEDPSKSTVNSPFTGSPGFLSSREPSEITPSGAGIKRKKRANSTDKDRESTISKKKRRKEKEKEKERDRKSEF
ncbi:MED6 mediator sub complex component-domain-containing protein [Paraphysoderma sedebokerense]|nr:MED6 mediator sub complex component-domain-containing protein [Paraphysoderma sedebokerense]